MIIKFGSFNRVNPPHELVMTQDGVIQSSILQNYILRNNKITKVGGTEAYNSTALTYGIPWVSRGYFKNDDGSFSKRTLCFSRGVIYSGDDVAGTLTSRVTGFEKNAIPLDATFQVSGRSIQYIFTGHDYPYSYNGNGSFTFEKTSLSTAYQQGLVHLERMWYVSRNSSSVDYSESLFPENSDSAVSFGSDKDSFVQRIVVGAGEVMYAFKNESIWQLYGRTKATFQTRKITEKYGLASKRSIFPVGSGFIFLNTFDKELYFFGGSEASITPLTENDIRFREILNHTKVDNVCMTVHDGLFRCAFEYSASDINYNSHELVYTLNEPDQRGLPKWSLIKGSNVLSYSTWNQQGDNELVKGRSDTGKLMYHNRGQNWDGLAGTAIETIVKTGAVLLSEKMNCEITGMWLRAKPGSSLNTVRFRYFMNAHQSDHGQDDVDTKGETRTIGEINLSQQDLFFNMIRPLTGKNRGITVQFEVYDNNTRSTMELYSISFDVNELYEVRTIYR